MNFMVFVMNFMNLHDFFMNLHDFFLSWVVQLVGTGMIGAVITSYAFLEKVGLNSF